ncbi:MAG: hypothetical protein WD810_04395 [Solirubrobacterales bacterium]
MLDLGRYLLGVAELALLAGFALLGAARLRSRLLPRFEGAPAHLATAVLALALLIWSAEIFGTVSLFEPLPYLLVVAAVGLALRTGISADSAAPSAGGVVAGVPRGAEARPAPSTVGDAATTGPAGGAVGPSLIAFAIAALALVRFADGARLRLSTGMTGFDTTWYHGPFAAGFFQSGSTWDLHFIAPQFLAWFYPANGEIFHAVGMLAFGRDVLSPLLNLGWFVGCLVAVWCIGRPYRVAPWSLALGAIALSVPALSDQAGEARNDIVGIFFLLAAVAVAVNAWACRGEGERSLPTGGLVVIGLSAGLAAGTKLNFLLAAAVLVIGLVAIAPGGARWRALAAAGLAALAAGGYWYLRNLVHTGNPLPWIHHLGPISLPAPEQGLGGREAHGVLDYLTDGTVWSDWFLPGLHDGLWIIWPLLGAAALAGLLLALGSRTRPSRGSLITREVQKEPRDGEGRDPILSLAGLVGLATALAWLVAPTSASGPDGMPRGFESGLRYLAPALVLGLTLLPATPPIRPRLLALSSRFVLLFDPKRQLGGGAARWVPGPRVLALVAGAAVVAAIAAGYPIQRHYLQSRYADPSFTTPGLNAAFEWSRDMTDARIATTSTRQYPLFGTDLSNHVQLIGQDRPHGGFEAAATSPARRRLLNAGHYDYVIATRDRIEPGKPPYPSEARWTEAPGARPILKKPPTVVFELNGRLDPASCSS